MHALQQINNSFFDSSYQEIWRKLNPEGLTLAEVAFLTSFLEEGKASRVLDLMCGYGRHALELARRGSSITAVDSLPAYIKEVNGVAEKEGLKVEGQCSNVLDFEPQGNYDLTICMGNSFAFFDKESCLQLLNKISLHSPVGSYLVINSWMIAEIAIRHFKAKEWMEVGDYKYLLDYSFHFSPNRIESNQTIIHPDGNKEELKGVDYIFTLDEMEEMFKLNNFKVSGLFSTPRKRPFLLGDSQIYIVAEKF